MILTIGDLHLQEKDPKKGQTVSVLEWIKDSQYNISENTLLLLGDLLETINSVPELLEIYIDYFLNKYLFKEIWIIQGNHDCAIYSSILSAFRPIKKVKIITSVEKIKVDNTNMLFLPHYKHEGTTLPKLRDYYSSLNFEETFDFCFTHVIDETLRGAECNLSQLKVKQYLSGHSHFFNIDDGGHYLGAAILNSKAETGRKVYGALIDTVTATFSLVEIPKFLEYYEIHYPEPLYPIETKYGLFTIFDSIIKEETLDFYKKDAEKKGIDFYSLKTIHKKTKEEELLLSQRQEKMKSDIEYFQDYVKTNNVNKNIVAIIEPIIRKE